MLTHIFDRTRQKTRVLQRGFMPPALRAHVIIPVFRGAYAPRYEYAAPVGALFSLIHLSIFIPPPVGLCFRSSPRCIHTVPCRGSVFGHPLAVFIPPPCRGSAFGHVRSPATCHNRVSHTHEHGRKIAPAGLYSCGRGKMVASAGQSSLLLSGSLFGFEFLAQLLRQLYLNVHIAQLVGLGRGG